MGLATSQVRLLALTSRKSDVEFKMQLNAKRKTMLMREGTTLSKLYYAKLQQARYQYSTDEGYNDVNYGYIMGAGNNNDEPSIKDIRNGTIKAEDRNIPGAYITDASGNVVVNNDLYKAILEAYNNYKGKTLSTKELVLQTLHNLLNNQGQIVIPQDSESTVGGSTGYVFSSTNSASSKTMTLFQILANYSINDSEIFTTDKNQMPSYGTRAGKFSLIDDLDKISEAENITKITDAMDAPMADTYYIYNNKLCYAPVGWEALPDSQYLTGYKEGIYICSINTTTTDITFFKQLANLYKYYGAMLEHVFENNGTSLKLSSLPSTNNNNQYEIKEENNTEYKKLQDVDYLQEAFRSGAFTLVCIDEDTDASGLDYFINRQYFVEKADTDSRESITAWFNAKKAELDEKETYWDSEINALSTELETINTEMESIKSLRDNAIQTTFKWGAA